MCLLIKEGQRKLKAKADIICYKIVEGMSIDNIHSFYQIMPVEIGKTYESLLRVNPYAKDQVEEGLHSFASLDGVLDFMKDNWSSWECCGYDIFIVECIIPKNSYYYKGEFYYNCYASDKITYVKHIENAKEL